MDGLERYEAGKAAAEQLRPGVLQKTKPQLRQLKLYMTRLDRYIRQAETAAAPADPERWLLDNQYLIQLAGQSIQEGFRKAGRLPVLEEDGTSCRLVVLAREIAALPEATALTQEDLCSFLSGLQSAEPLLERELRTLLSALQFAALEQLVQALGLTAEGRKVLFAQACSALRHWSDLNFQAIAEQSSLIHAAFLTDPSGDYPQMPARDRGQYRKRLEQLSRRKGLEEAEAARALVEEAEGRHIGFLLFREDSMPVRVLQAGYYPGIAIVSLILALWLGFLTGRGWSFFLFWLPVAQIWKSVLDAVLVRVLPPRPVFRLALRAGLSKSERTLVVKAAVLGKGGCLEEAHQLERVFLANRDCGEELSLGLLVDLPERNTPLAQTDRESLSRLKAVLDKLNRKYGGRFFLFFRAPVYQNRQGTFSGWERKRGALLELAQMLRARRSGIEVYSGDRTRLNRVRYLVVLDSDTDPGVGGIRPLVGAMRHPLNRPVLDERRRVVRAGYGIIQPQIRTELAAASATPFARFFSGGAGSDPYRGSHSELCHELFDESSFCGKGILDIDCFLTCLEGRFPEQRVLSHDILEGAYLRTGYLSQISFRDGFPATVSSFYRRQHRWVRGDWQNFAWVLPHVPSGEGAELNPISAVSRWKLADNLRRSLTPVVQMVCLLWGAAAGDGFGWLGWIALASVALDPILAYVFDIIPRRSLRRFHSRIQTGLRGMVLGIGVRLALLPLEGWINLTAICTALWRSLISHKNLLQWTTSAQQSAVGGGLLSTCLPILAVGLGTAAVTRRPAALLLALLWLFSPVIVTCLERRPPKARLHSAERAFLLHEAELIWGFFDDFLQPERNYLPPDNFQLRPYQGPAERTSPTNIGFAALSCMAAVDLGLESRENAVERLAGMLDTLERMEKWRGNLFNWYHTITLKPMEPRVVSSVDSGNLCACLFALAAGLEEWGRKDLARRALALARGAELGALYDPDKHLFYISYEPDSGNWSASHYDLMASEARLLSYIALAQGQVEHRHWAALSRAQASAHGYQGMVSWFGTMFEYFMPHLLLPLPEDSFLYESLAFCACEQLSFGRERAIPWGVSESAVPALDQNGCYGYRANGVPAIALCHLPDRPPVVAPYATYLALSILPHRAVENLHRLREDGLEGKYGLYEAAEYGSDGVLAARSWMSHHMGMSLTAIDNALHDQILVKRFLSQPEMGACRSLLEEAVPRGSRPLNRRRRPAPAVRERADTKWKLTGERVDGQNPVCTLLQSPGISAVVANSGYCWLSGERESLTARREPPALFLRRGDRVFPLFPCPSGARVRWTLGERQCTFLRRLEEENIVARLEIQLSPSGNLEWSLELSGALGDSALLFLLRPQLATERDFLAHPAFSLLRIETEHSAQRVLFHRRSGSQAHPDLSCKWTGPDIQSFVGVKAVARQSELGLPEADPSLLLELPLKDGGGKTARMEVQLATGEATRRNRTALSQPPELLDLSARLLPNLIFAPQLGRDGAPGPQRLLWSLGISGDAPIVMSYPPAHQEQWRLWVRTWQYLCSSGVPFDLVMIADAAQAGQLRSWAAAQGISWGGHCGLHLVAADPANEALLKGMACARLDCLPEPGKTFGTAGADRSWSVPQRENPQWHWDGNRFRLSCRGNLPPVRWSIPLTNGGFGYLAMDTGGGYLWSKNARLFRITPWDNNPWAQEGPEDLSLLVEGREISLFARRDGLDCTLTFGPGFLRWEKKLIGECRSVLTAFVPPKRNERVLLLELHNLPQDAKLLWRIQPQMGEYLTQGLWATGEVRENSVWLKNPVSERSGIRLSASVPWDEIRLPEGRERAVVLTGAASPRMVLQAGEPCARLTEETAGALLAETEALWQNRCSSLEVVTPDKALNHYLGFWGQYQVQASRMLSRTSVYQCGGAYGFRDQLQDCCALFQSNPALAREHILRCCRHQFTEGDVLHWWHEIPGGGADAGVRTRMTDDLLWLPYTLSVWWEETGDTELLGRQEPYLAGERLGPEEKDRYFAPAFSEERESVYRHGIRAVECVLGRGVGAHGLCKMGGGDWNDGMDKVGSAGRGESVWLTWFAVLVLRRFATVCEAMNEPDRAGRYRSTAGILSESAQQCWDGAWFLRGYFDSGAPLGGSSCLECQIDSISQSFAALACGDQPRVRQALEHAQALLMDEESGTVALLDPPFDGKGPDPGYIADYRPGNRENGGQYTHAAVWLALAWFQLGEADRGWSILRTLLPEHHPVERYRAEPFVLAADVSRERGKEGAAGWSWYTGAAGWYWRVAVRELLGIRFRGGLLYLKPNLPSEWPGYRAAFQLDGGRLEIEVAYGVENRMFLDGCEVSQGISLSGLKGRHSLRLEILRKRGCATEGNHV